MKRLDRFVLKAFLGPFAAILLIVVFVLMLHFLWLYIDELVGKGLGFRVIAEFLMWGTCTILPLALPLATLLSSMMTFGQMTENKELMAVKASGISFVRVMTPLIIVSAFIALGAYYIGDNLVPRAYMEIYQLRTDIGKTKEEKQAEAETAKTEGADEPTKAKAEGESAVAATREVLTSIFSSTVTAVKNSASDAAGAVVDGVKNAADAAAEGVKNAADAAVEGVKNIFGGDK